jgi:membrane peptidoglycan carboxypeptidase
VVVVDSSTGRVLSILNQKLSLGDGFQPCSTFKVSVALAALSEKVIATGDTVPVGRANIDLTDALAHSNNHFFANVGCELGFEKVSHYAHQFGYGEKAGMNIVGEGAGHFPPAPPSNGGVGRLSSFGEEIGQTPLQFAALMGAIANGGTLYCLQYPRNAQEVASLTPKVKRKLSDMPYNKVGELATAKIGMANVSIDLVNLRRVLPSAPPVPRLSTPRQSTMVAQDSK